MAVFLALRGFIAFIPAFIWKWLAIALAIVAMYFYAYERGHKAAEVACERKAVIAQQAANKQDTQADIEVRAQDKQAVMDLQNQKKVDDADIESLKAQLAKRAITAPCVYDNSNADPDQRASERVRVPVVRPRASNKKHP